MLRTWALPDHAGGRRHGARPITWWLRARVNVTIVMCKSFALSDLRRCSNCLDSSGECLWCRSLGSCIYNDDYTFVFPFGECSAFDYGYYGCRPECTGLRNTEAIQPWHSRWSTILSFSDHLTCTTCSSNVGCGWCGPTEDEIWSGFL